MARIDHIVIAVGDLQQASAAFTEQLGLSGYHGGRVSGIGTESFIIPLGTSYVELIAVNEEREATTNPLGRAVSEAVQQKEATFLTWAIEPSESLQHSADRLELSPHLMKRSLPDGGDVACNIAGLQQAVEEPPLPYFVEWQNREEHPTTVPVEDDHQHMGVAWIELAGDQQRLETWLGDSTLPLQFVEGSPGVRGISILTEGQPIVLREPLQLASLPQNQLPSGDEAEEEAEREAWDQPQEEGDDPEEAAAVKESACPRVGCSPPFVGAMLQSVENAVESAAEVFGNVAGQMLSPRADAEAKEQ